MAKQTDEQIVRDRTTEALAKSGEAANEMIKGNAGSLTEMRIPTQSGQGFRFDVGHRSDLIPATIPK